MCMYSESEVHEFETKPFDNSNNIVIKMCIIVLYYTCLLSLVLFLQLSTQEQDEAAGTNRYVCCACDDSVVRHRGLGPNQSR